MGKQENYTLTVNKVMDEVGGQRSENHTYAATSSADLKYMLQLAGVIDYAQELPCGCVNDCVCSAQEDVAAQVMPQTSTAYDYEDTFTPNTDMPEWTANSYEKFVNTPASQWPMVFETLTLELIDKGLTKEEAEQKLFNLLDINEHFDYGHGNTLDNQTTVSIKGMNIDRGSLRKFKQNYVQARYSDNPLSNNNEVSESLEDKYENFLREYTNINLKKITNYNIPYGSVFYAGKSGSLTHLIVVLNGQSKKPLERNGNFDMVYSVRMISLDDKFEIKKQENRKMWGSQINRQSNDKLYVGKFLGVLKYPVQSKLDLSSLDLSTLKENVIELTLKSNKNSKGEHLSLSKKKNEYGEYTVKFFVNGKYDDDASYHTDNWDDAVSTFKDMKKRIEMIKEDVSNSFQYKRELQLAAKKYLKDFEKMDTKPTFAMRSIAKSLATKFSKDEMAVRKELEAEISKKKVSEARYRSPSKFKDKTVEDSSFKEDVKNGLKFPYSYLVDKNTGEIKKVKGDTVSSIASNLREKGYKIPGNLNNFEDVLVKKGFKVYTGMSHGGWTLKGWGRRNTPARFVTLEEPYVDPTAKEPVSEAKEVKVLAHFKDSPTTQIVAVPARDKVTRKPTTNIIIRSIEGNTVLMRSAGTDWNKIKQILKDRYESRFKKAGEVIWLVGESEEISEHENYQRYVQLLRDIGFSVYVSRTFGENGWLFEVEKDGKELTVYEPVAGTYFIQGDKTKTKYDSLNSALSTVWPEANSVSESGTRLDPKCWDGYKISNPKTKISPRTGKRVNNCVTK